MSRYNMPTKELEKFKCIVGYDSPLDTLFAQVIDLEEQRREEERASRIAQAQDAGLDPEETDDEADEDREPFVLWIGTSAREITDVEVLRRAIEPYAALSSEIQQRLLWDQRRQSHPPTPFQQQMRDLVERIAKDVDERRSDDGGAE